MKSIGVYGDSFAGMINAPEYEETHWSRLLAKNYAVPFTDYSLPGSSIYFSYKQFLKNYNKHDLNIFCVTDHSRYHSMVKTVYGNQFIGGVNSNQRSIDPSPEDLRGWFMCQNDEYSLDMAVLMIEQVRSLDNKVILIPCFNSSLPKKYINDVLGLELNNNLQAIVNLQISHFGFTDYSEFMEKYEESEILTGHFAPETNEIFLPVLKNRIETGIWDWKIPKKLNLKYTFDRYYERKN